MSKKIIFDTHPIAKIFKERFYKSYELEDNQDEYWPFCNFVFELIDGHNRRLIDGHNRRPQYLRRTNSNLYESSDLLYSSSTLPTHPIASIFLAELDDYHWDGIQNFQNPRHPACWDECNCNEFNCFVDSLRDVYLKKVGYTSMPVGLSSQSMYKFTCADSGYSPSMIIEETDNYADYMAHYPEYYIKSSKRCLLKNIIYNIRLNIAHKNLSLLSQTALPSDIFPLILTYLEPDDQTFAQNWKERRYHYLENFFDHKSMHFIFTVFMKLEDESYVNEYIIDNLQLEIRQKKVFDDVLFIFS